MALHSSGMARSLLSSRDTRRPLTWWAHWSPAATLQHDTVRMLHLTAQHSRISPFPGSPAMAISQHQAVVYLKASIDYHEPTRMAAHAILGVRETQLVGWDSLCQWTICWCVSSNKTKGRMLQQIDRGFQTKEKGHAVGSRCLSPQKKAKILQNKTIT